MDLSIKPDAPIDAEASDDSLISVEDNKEKPLPQRLPPNRKDRRRILSILRKQMKKQNKKT